MDSAFYTSNMNWLLMHAILLIVREHVLVMIKLVMELWGFFWIY
jgi:hypothetical protein